MQVLRQLSHSYFHPVQSNIISSSKLQRFYLCFHHFSRSLDLKGWSPARRSTLYPLVLSALFWWIELTSLILSITLNHPSYWLLCGRTRRTRVWIRTLSLVGFFAERELAALKWLRCRVVLSVKNRLATIGLHWRYAVFAQARASFPRGQRPTLIWRHHFYRTKEERRISLQILLNFLG